MAKKNCASLRLVAVAGLGFLSVSPAAAEEPPAPAVPAAVPTATSAYEETPAPIAPAADTVQETPALASTAQAPAAAAPAAPAPAIPLEDRVRELEETVRKLTEQLKSVQQQQAPPAKPAPDAAQVEKIVDDKLKKQKPLVGWQNGFFLESPDGNFRLRLRTQIQSDFRVFTSGGGRTGVDSFFLRRARPIFEGTIYKHWDFRIMPDFGQGTTTLFDAYGEYHQYPYAVLRVGKFKEPVSLERLQGAPDLHFLERSIAQNLAPNRDVGVQLSGEVLKRTLTYYLSAFNGVNDNGSTDGDLDNDKNFAGRLFYEPFKNRPNSFLQGFGAGVGASVGEESDPLVTTFRTAGRSAFFRYRQAGTTPGATGAGTHTRVFPGFYLFKGPLGLMGEYFDSRQEVSRGDAKANVKNSGYFAQASWVLTGEKSGFRNLTPRHDFDPSRGHWGAFEVAARFSRIDMDDVIYRRDLANRTNSIGSANEWTFGLNWYLNRAVKIQFNYVHTIFDRDITIGDVTTDHEDVFLSRFQVAF